MINLYILGEKGFIALRSLNKDYFSLISNIIVGTDRNVINDYSEDSIFYCKNNELKYEIQNKTLNSENIAYSIAIGWRWLINDNSKLIVFHDSLLPKLRGFNPLVTSLINGDKEIGVTVLEGTNEFDKGSILLQEKIEVNYPKKICQAINEISLLYGQLLNELLSLLKVGNYDLRIQDESKATYSLWRNDEDYIINWNLSSKQIKRFIDAVGYPYKGAYTFLENKKIVIKDAFEVEDVCIENRDPGKLLFKKENGFYIVCGEGLLCIKDFFDENDDNITINNFRIKFK